jgi:hypothetical protein
MQMIFLCYEVLKKWLTNITLFMFKDHKTELTFFFPPDSERNLYGKWLNEN